VITAPPNPTDPIATTELVKPATPGRARFDATVVFNRFICREHYLLRMRIDPAGPAFPKTLPGQFIQLGCRTPNGQMDLQSLMGNETEWSSQQPPQLQQPELCEKLAMLRRPLSLAGRGEEEITVSGEKRTVTWIEIIHRIVGIGTQWLSQLK
jgi:hypothetical protein